MAKTKSFGGVGLGRNSQFISNNKQKEIDIKADGIASVKSQLDKVANAPNRKKRIVLTMSQEEFDLVTMVKPKDVAFNTFLMKLVVARISDVAKNDEEARYLTFRLND